MMMPSIGFKLQPSRLAHKVIQDVYSIHTSRTPSATAVKASLTDMTFMVSYGNTQIIHDMHY